MKSLKSCNRRVEALALPLRSTLLHLHFCLIAKSFWPDCKPEGPLFSAEFIFEFQNSGPIFFRLCLLCIVKKFDSIRTKLTEEIDFEV